MKQIVALMLCLAFLTVTAATFAEDVYVTKYGKKYHAENCPLIANRDVQKISLKEAEAKGLEPCKRCIDKSEEAAKTETRNTEEVASAINQ